MITDIPISNKFIPRNDWYLRSFKCKKYDTNLSDAAHHYKLIYIINEILEKTKISRELFTSRARYRRAVEARQIYFKRAKETTSAALSVIGSMVKSGSHANVIYGIKQVNTIPSLIKKYNELFN